MSATFVQLNQGWNAEPNAPCPDVIVQGRDVLLTFFVNAFQFEHFAPDERGVLRFVNAERYRLGPTNDEGWYRGECRFSQLAPAWGEFYLVSGDASVLDAPDDWRVLGPRSGAGRHFLFYFRDSTFECVAQECVIEASADNALHRQFPGARLTSRCNGPAKSAGS